MILEDIANAEDELDALKENIIFWIAEHVSTDNNGKIHILYDGESMDELMRLARSEDETSVASRDEA